MPARSKFIKMLSQTRFKDLWFISVLKKGKGANMGQNNYARSELGENVFPGSKMSLENKNWSNLGDAVTFS